MISVSTKDFKTIPQTLKLLDKKRKKASLLQDIDSGKAFMNRTVALEVNKTNNQQVGSHKIKNLLNYGINC